MRSRQIAVEQVETFQRQQRNITKAELSITVQSNQGKAERIARTGIAQAIATEEQVAAYGGPQFQVTQQVMNRFAEAVQQSRVDVVPRVVVGGGSGEGGASGSNIMEGLLTLLLSDKLNLAVSGETAKERNPEADKLREEIRQSLSEKRQAPDAGTTPPAAKA